jgi:peptidoglycan/LPS O-acetylase OafA/YrhL
VLIVTSTYAPAMLADTHRARMLAWELPERGWDVEILCPDSAFQHPSCVESDSEAFFARRATVHRVGEFAGSFFRRLGMRAIGWRSIWPLYRRGKSLLESQRFDLVFFSTTQFNLFILGPLWRASTGTPYVLDFHDPWHKLDIQYQTSRHVLKLELARLLARVLEPVAVRRAAGIMTVSPAYLDALSERYAASSLAWLGARRHATIPFAASLRDFDTAALSSIQTARRDDSAPLRLVYVGAGGDIMRRSFVRLCDAVVELLRRGDPLASRLRIELYGTLYGWTAGMGRPLHDIAIQHGLGAIVEEHPERVTYRRSIELLSSSNGALVLGVDDGGYMPSKLFSYALSGKPLLALLRHGSPAWRLLDGRPEIGRVLTFGAANDGDELERTADTLAAHLHDMERGTIVDRRQALEPFLAPAMADRTAELFAASIENPTPTVSSATDAARIRGLDSIRFICALWVLLGHFAFLRADGLSRTDPLQRIFRGVLGNLFAGQPAVIVFFLISGFCIHYRYRSGTRKPGARFLVRRYLRIGLPLLAAAAIVARYAPGSAAFDPRASSDSVVWSLIAEVVYYTLYPVLFVAWRRFGWNAVFAASVVLSLAVIATQPRAPYLPSYGVWATWIVGLPYWILGCILASRHSERSRPRATGITMWCWRLGVWAGASMASALLFHANVGYPWTMLVFGIAAFAWLRLEIAWHRERAPWRILEWAGTWSYSIYAMHLPLIEILERHGVARGATIMRQTIFIVAVLAGCYAFFLLVEKPAHWLSRRVSSARTSAARAPAAAAVT